MINTNASGILGTWESKRYVSPVAKLFALGRTTGNDIISSIARGWTLGKMEVSAFRTLSSRFRDIALGSGFFFLNSVRKQKHFLILDTLFLFLLNPFNNVLYVPVTTLPHNSYSMSYFDAFGSSGSCCG